MGGHGLAASHSTSFLSKLLILGGATGGSCFLEVDFFLGGGGRWVDFCFVFCFLGD